MPVSVLKARLLCHRLGARNPPFNAFASDPEWRRILRTLVEQHLGFILGHKDKQHNTVRTARRDSEAQVEEH